jgi:hypothetical protein
MVHLVDQLLEAHSQTFALITPVIMHAFKLRLSPGTTTSIIQPRGFGCSRIEQMQPANTLLDLGGGRTRVNKHRRVILATMNAIDSLGLASGLAARNNRAAWVRFPASQSPRTPVV